MINQMKSLRARYDRLSRPIIARLDEITELKKRYVELPVEIQIEQSKLREKWREAGEKMWEDFRRLENE